jgi:hypothetical protein
MAVNDIGFLIFSEFLGMTQYPGAPFTGNIVKDSIQFLFIPTVFIILVVYLLVSRLALPGSKIRILISIASYLFILTSGYYKVFALLAGPYFIFLIFFLGLLYFIPAHFGSGGGGEGNHLSGGALGHRRRGGHSDIDDDYRVDSLLMDILSGGQKLDPTRRREAKSLLEDIEYRIKEIDKLLARNVGNPDKLLLRREDLVNEQLRLQRKLGRR